jgi:uncharacterized membrane protein YozB (DUF420 family)
MIGILPAINATLNAASASLLLAGYVCIRRKQQEGHRRCMLAAFGTSVLFLASYLVLRYHAGVTRFPGEGWIRPVYFTVLLSHTVLAAGMLPLVLITLRRGLRGDYLQHARIARWTLPIWLYVSITGVLVYWLLYHW